MREMFQPIGDRARWRICYDVLKQHDIGDIIRYETVQRALDDGAGIEEVQQSVRRASLEFLEADHRALDNVPGEGYRVVHAEEHLELARRDQRRSHKALARGHSLVVHADMNLIDDPLIRQSFGRVAQAFQLQMEFNRRMDVRQEELEAAITLVHVQSEKTAEEVAELKARLARIEQVQ